MHCLIKTRRALSPGRHRADEGRRANEGRRAAERRPADQERSRSGSLVIEAVIAVLMLATASLAVMRLARSSVDLHRRADHELTAALTAQNALSRLGTFSWDQLSGPLADVERSYSDDSGCEVTITTKPFDRDAGSGIHLRVDVASGNQVRVTLHDWRLDDGAPSAAENSPGDVETSDVPDGPQNQGTVND